ncbi:MAG: 3-hydroxybutyryl-CoA dehydrogenase [Hyphomicrobiales bacterium]|nr:3-hydroxybutyryl-CoA dehydrogenase [Hyphomicrobiales bacterium]
MSMRIATLGAGRMGRGLAVVFAYAGANVAVVDFKERPAPEFEKLAAEARDEIVSTLHMLCRIGLMETAHVDRLTARISILPLARAAETFGDCEYIFEALPEVLAVKRQALKEASRMARSDAIIASTTSTILVDDLSDAVVDPARFINAHWLNPAYLVPLVELSVGRRTSPETTQQIRSMLEGVGKVPVVCGASPGYIVPRIQGMAMNEAARMVEEGVASAEDIDKAVIYGFGFRFAILGLLEFIDWGGGDILYYTSRYMTEALGHDRYAAPQIIETNMKEGRIGLKTRQGFLNYDGVDVESYREKRLAAFADSLRRLGLARSPVL